MWHATLVLDNDWALRKAIFILCHESMELMISRLVYISRIILSCCCELLFSGHFVFLLEWNCLPGCLNNSVYLIITIISFLSFIFLIMHWVFCSPTNTIWINYLSQFVSTTSARLNWQYCVSWCYYLRTKRSSIKRKTSRAILFALSTWTVAPLERFVETSPMKDINISARPNFNDFEINLSLT